MKINILASGSSGNCYVIEDKQGNQMLLECGIKYEKIIPHIDFEMLDCLLTTHAHFDHSLCIDKFRDNLVDTYTTDNAIAGKPIKLKNWTILPIQMFHNINCFGYMIHNKIENKTILFATDTNGLPDIADRHFDCMMLECNYNYNKMLDNSQAKILSSDGYKNHMALEDLVEWLRVREVKPAHLVAIHISGNGNLDKDLAQQELSQFAHKFSFAKKGVIIEV